MKADRRTGAQDLLRLRLQCIVNAINRNPENVCVGVTGPIETGSQAERSKAKCMACHQAVGQGEKVFALVWVRTADPMAEAVMSPMHADCADRLLHDEYIRDSFFQNAE